MRKTMLHFFTIADFEEEEIWLREQHKSGWKLVKMIPPCVYIFESCRPEDVIYRMDYKNSRQTEEYMQMVKDFGWEYFAECVGWLYFRKKANEVESENEGELFSDNVSRTEMVMNIVKTRLLPICIIFFSCVIPNLLTSVRGALGALSTVFVDVFGVFFIIYVYLIVYCGIKLRKIRKKYEE